MTVDQLIKALQDFDGKANVAVSYDKESLVIGSEHILHVGQE